MKSLIALAFVFAATSAQAATLANVKQALCQKGESFLQLNRSTNILKGKIGTLSEMVNIAVGETQPGAEIEYIQGNPDEGFVALGALVTDQTGYWGSLSVYTPAGRQLTSEEKLSVLFVDAEGTVQQEELNCLLMF